MRRPGRIPATYTQHVPCILHARCSIATPTKGRRQENMKRRITWKRSSAWTGEANAQRAPASPPPPPPDGSSSFHRLRAPRDAPARPYPCSIYAAYMQHAPCILNVRCSIGFSERSSQGKRGATGSHLLNLSSCIAWIRVAICSRRSATGG